MTLNVGATVINIMYLVYNRPVYRREINENSARAHTHTHTYVIFNHDDLQEMCFYVSFVFLIQCKTHTHTHTHTYIYIYIYIYRPSRKLLTFGANLNFHLIFGR
jgi:hypothetical protein